MKRYFDTRTPILQSSGRSRNKAQRLLPDMARSVRKANNPSDALRPEKKPLKLLKDSLQRKPVRGIKNYHQGLEIVKVIKRELCLSGNSYLLWVTPASPVSCAFG